MWRAEQVDLAKRRLKVMHATLGALCDKGLIAEKSEGVARYGHWPRGGGGAGSRVEGNVVRRLTSDAREAEAARWARAALAAMEALEAPELAELLRRHALCGEPLSEIARAQGCSRQTAYNRYMVCVYAVLDQFAIENAAAVKIAGNSGREDSGGYSARPAITRVEPAGNSSASWRTPVPSR